MIGKMLAGLAALILITGCSGAENEPSNSEEMPADAPSPTADETPAPALDQPAPSSENSAAAPEPAQEVDLVEAGRKAFTQCAVCHKVKEGERSLVGPNLYGIVGATAGAADFNYSDAVRNSGIVWTEENLDAFMENPRELIPGNRMAYAGERNAEKRAAIVEYLKSLTAE
ncbi:MAG: c-type cytochrome [Marinicaulis sp.]|nr:c-type cytochrome [Marinicaulis sp.]